MKETIDYWHPREAWLPNLNNLLKEKLIDCLVVSPWDIQFKKISWQDKIQIFKWGCYITTITDRQYNDLQKTFTPYHH